LEQEELYQTSPDYGKGVWMKKKDSQLNLVTTCIDAAR
jgi:hypothetical protein